MLYAALCRVIMLSNLYIEGGFNSPAEPKESDPILNEIKNLQKNKCLDTGFDLIQHESGIAIGYHNIRSFAKHRQHIANDYWYNSCAIQILSETRTIKSDKVSLPNHNLGFRSDDFARGQARGILLFCKPGPAIEIIGQQVLKSGVDDKSHHSVIVVFKVKDTNVITGYK